MSTSVWAMRFRAIKGPSVVSSQFSRSPTPLRDVLARYYRGSEGVRVVKPHYA